MSTAPVPPLPVIEVEALSFAYDGLRVLENVTLAVAGGEFLGLVGPNAGGKSTLLKLILGLLEPTGGRLRVLGLAPKQARRRIGYVPQYPAFARDFPITVGDAVLMGRLGTRGLVLRYSPRDHQAMERALCEVEAEDLARRPIGKLSGGQLQRVLLARALVSEPEILILDEPTANIDQRLEGEIFELLARLNARMTILVVSHDIAFISGYVSRVACLNRTLVCHTTGEIDGNVITDLYGEQVRGIVHAH
ncbi:MULTISPECIES: metal ABC transporter ATP-binding protein [Thiorhodovibrio]|uniref:metal ABC transporter ATP-binding protein n=1 Tax=Thiorhodovibrio TaxID=61593 RepID=UPI002B263BB2|nr:metal ABC transporter ATP-binding protein [Thiorhodovibrio litoralis]WPL14828.1 putative zinc transport system ATP-binding protein AdcC [Thiorhodovibrio litoralis]